MRTLANNEQWELRGTTWHMLGGEDYSPLAAEHFESYARTIQAGEDRRNANRVTCDQCQLARINGTICHETGCPNAGAKWEDGEWVKYRECFECGCDVRAGEECDCQEPMDEEEEPEYFEFPHAEESSL